MDDLLDKLRIVFDWAGRARFDASLLNMVLGKRLLVTVKDGDVSFAAPANGVSPAEDWVPVG